MARRKSIATAQSMKPAFDGEDIRAKLERYDRGPFLDLLKKMLDMFPDDTSLKALAMKKPELYISSLIAMARISGFTEKQEVHHEHTINIHKMSDSQLEDHAKQLLESMGFEGKTIDLQANSPGKGREAAIVEEAIVEIKKGASE